MRKIIFVLIIILLLLLVFQMRTHAAIKVSPMIVELDANSARGNYLTTSINVQGGDDETIRFKVYPGFFEINKEGRMEPIAKTDVANSLVHHARVTPNEFTLQKGQAQKVRLTFTDLKTLPDGESRMVIFLEDVATKEMLLPRIKNGISTRLIVKTRIGVPIYIEKGNVIRTGVFDDLRVEKKDKNLVYVMNLRAEGNSKVRYSGSGQILRGNTPIDEFRVTSSVVGGGNTAVAKGELPLNKIAQNGDYTLKVMLNYKDAKGKTKKLIKEVTFNVEKVESTSI